MSDQTFTLPPCHCQKSPFDARDWKYADILKSKTSASAITASFPDEVDYRPLMQPVRNQGSRGTCASFASSAMKELQEKKDVGLNSYMSPEFIYDNRTNYPSEGMYCRDVMDILSNKGVCFEEIYPYASADKPASDIPQVAKDVAIKFKIKSYAMVSSVDELKTALAASGPCLIAFPCYNSSMTFWMPSKAGEALRGGHAVLIVGYTKDSFIVRNSWGTSWGDKGYTYYPFTQWGAQWECWTAVDDASPKDVPLPPPPTPHKPCGCVIA